jgi:3-oxoacyl-[acyl-carrier protein] reductase
MSETKTVLISGGSQGIGRAIAVKFALENFEVAITARNEEKLKKTGDIIRQNGASPPYVIPGDLQNPADIKHIVQETIKKFSKIDILVNNAGVMYLKPFLELSLDEYEQMMQVNMRAVFLLTQSVVQDMIKREKGGTIINIASLAGKNGFKTGTGYATSKWALRGFSNCLMQEVREYDIRVVTIFPGSVDTNLGRGGFSPTGTPRENKMQPEDVAEAVFLSAVMPQRTMVSEIDLRPSNPKKRVI